MTFEVDPAGLRDADERVGMAIVDADTMLGQFETEIEAFGEPWGHDDLGGLIGEVYQAAYAMAMNCFNSNLDTMDAYATRLGVAADSYEQTDQASAEQSAAVQNSHPNLPL
ncbi:MAG TPA: hypothetical protein DGT23_15895 [Micromonosporaceae bacterium]|nr:hypothetical protein [Micromonosporaceae bacterium]